SSRLMPQIWHITLPMGISCQVENTREGAVNHYGKIRVAIYRGSLSDILACKRFIGVFVLLLQV
ncbi:hypothetical protein ACGYLL_19410, partial [Sulfitobacter sp. M23905]